jgi:hypothetical protein
MTAQATTGRAADRERTRGASGDGPVLRRAGTSRHGQDSCEE